MAREILGYFLRNPFAADSLEGIATWRLLDETIHRRVEDARYALDWLVSEGYLRERMSRGTAPLYSLNQGKRSDAEMIVKQRSPLAPPLNGGNS
jgi:hypothetical protein